MDAVAGLDAGAGVDAGTALDAGANAGPFWTAGTVFVTDSVGRGYKSPVAGTPYLKAEMCDAEGDDVKLDVEFALVDQPFKDLPSFTFTITLNRFDQFEKAYCGDLFAPLTGMMAGTYDGQAHASDARGAEGPFGWVRFAPLRFTLQP